MSFSRVSNSQRQNQRAPSVVYGTELTPETNLVKTVLNHSRGLRFRGTPKTQDAPSIGQQIRLGLLKPYELLPQGLTQIHEPPTGSIRIKNLIMYGLSLIAFYVCLSWFQLLPLNKNNSFWMAVSLFISGLLIYSWGHYQRFGVFTRNSSLKDVIVRYPKKFAVEFIQIIVLAMFTYLSFLILMNLSISSLPTKSKEATFYIIVILLILMLYILFMIMVEDTTLLKLESRDILGLLFFLLISSFFFSSLHDVMSQFAKCKIALLLVKRIVFFVTLLWTVRNSLLYQLLSSDRCHPWNLVPQINTILSLLFLVRFLTLKSDETETQFIPVFLTGFLMTLVFYFSAQNFKLVCFCENESLGLSLFAAGMKVYNAILNIAFPGIINLLGLVGLFIYLGKCFRKIGD